MSSLTDIEKRYLEKILEMGSGYVLDYSDNTFGEFFKRHRIDIHSNKYQTYGTSKAKKMRSFWEQESDQIVGKILAEMLDSYVTDCELEGRQMDAPVFKKAKEITDRLLGKKKPEKQTADTLASFLEREFTVPDIDKLPVEQAVVPIIQNRLKEAQKALSVGAYLSVIMLCGSILEGVLLGKAQREPAKFNTAKSSPKHEGKVKPFHQWSLANFIDVASEVGVLKVDVKTFSHGLRDFRNYIHPYQQMVSGFAPDEHTAKVCFQVLKAALASVAGKR